MRTLFLSQGDFYCHFPDLQPRQIAFSELRLGDEYTTPTHP
jgi:hypothetical protein